MHQQSVIIFSLASHADPVLWYNVDVASGDVCKT